VWLILTNDCLISNPVFTDGIFFACIIPRLRENKLSGFLFCPKPANSALRASNSAGFFGLTMSPSLTALGEDDYFPLFFCAEEGMIR
jgi:hypothetical protein